MQINLVCPRSSTLPFNPFLAIMLTALVVAGEGLSAKPYLSKAIWVANLRVLASLITIGPDYQRTHLYYSTLLIFSSGNRKSTDYSLVLRAKALVATAAVGRTFAAETFQGTHILLPVLLKL